MLASFTFIIQMAAAGILMIRKEIPCFCFLLLFLLLIIVLQFMSINLLLQLGSSCSCHAAFTKDHHHHDQRLIGTWTSSTMNVSPDHHRDHRGGKAGGGDHREDHGDHDVYGVDKRKIRTGPNPLHNR
ncbi:hypothetical protein Scep_013660 [Stephania cephalantha]|uniref:Uncharacterized protein n=1 Tax=Stephania cephalantha TaxID=152367 RepID=A0AAP0IZX5_9MAGN